VGGKRLIRSLVFAVNNPEAPRTVYESLNHPQPLWNRDFLNLVALCRGRPKILANTAEGRFKLKEQPKTEKRPTRGASLLKGGLTQSTVLCGCHLLGGSSSVADVVN